MLDVGRVPTIVAAGAQMCGCCVFYRLLRHAPTAPLKSPLLLYEFDENMGASYPDPPLSSPVCISACLFPLCLLPPPGSVAQVILLLTLPH